MKNEIKKIFRITRKDDRLKEIQTVSEKFIGNEEIITFCNAFILLIEKKYEKAFELIQNYENQESLILKGILFIYLKRYDKAEEFCKLSIEKDKKDPIAYNLLGNIYSKIKNYVDAEKYYKLSVENDESFPFPYYNLGLLYFEIKRYDEAESFFKQAINKDDKYSDSYNELGNLYDEIKKYDEAETYYKLSIEKDKKNSYPYNGLGNLYSDLKKYNEAETYYKLSIEKDVNNSYPYLNLGILYYGLNKYIKASEIAKRGLEVEKKNNPNDSESYLLSRFENLISEIANAEKLAENYDKIKEIEEEDPLKKILKEIKDNKIEEQTFLNKKKFLEFIKPIQQKNTDNYFKILRRWNSYTPIIADNYHISKGGGYFLKVDGLGIVIDPGFNFIENFKGADHLFGEIDAVFISHAHNDHTADLESILTLLYKYNEEIKDSDDSTNINSIRHEIAKKKNIDYKDVTPDEINKVFSISEKRKTIDIFITASTFKKSAGLFDLYTKNDYKIHIVEPDGKFNFKNIEVKVLKAKHHDIISDYFSVGFVFYVKETVLIYTGDTAWNFEIENQYKILAEENKGKYKILVAHIGGFKEYENTYLNSEYSGYDAFYKNHLGRLGLGKINETLQPDVCLMSEFGEEIKGNRIKICKIYEDAYKDTYVKKIKFFPADIGFTLNLNNNKIMGVSSINQDTDELNYEYIEQSNIEIAELRKDYSLNYYKKDSNFTESILIQILADKYERSRK
jgi:tetratricopeptide (TPR) repeat protein